MKKIGFGIIIILMCMQTIVMGQEDYVSSENFENFDVNSAFSNITELKSSIDALTNELYELDKKELGSVEGSISDKYRETRDEIVRVINDIDLTTKSTSKMLKKIAIYKIQIEKSVNEVKKIKEGLDDTKNYIEQFTNFMYKLDNEIYDDKTNTIDDIKLLTKSDNIPRTLVGQSLVKSMLLQFNDLMNSLNDSKKEKIEKIRKLNSLKIQTKAEIQGYKKQLDTLKQKKNYLVKFIELYKAKGILNQSFNKILNNKKDVHEAIMTFVDDISKKQYKKSFSIDDKIKNLNKQNDDSIKETTPLAWPIYPIENIEIFFDDQKFETEYGVPHWGIQIRSEQTNQVFSTRDGVIYHVSDANGFGISWVMIVHLRGYVSVYMYMNQILVKEGDVVKRGQLIGYSGGEPGTNGAGFISNGPNLSFQVYKNAVPIDPLLGLDLSIVKNKDTLPEDYQLKYLDDKYSRPIDITNLAFSSGKNLNERADNFLLSYGVGVYKELAFWEDVVEGTNIDRDVAICIAFAESTLGKHLSTSNNIGNVGNNDRGDRIAFNSSLAGARMISLTLNNQYLGQYHTINQLSRYGNENGKIYASSPINWQTNVLKCLSKIKGYYVPEDYPFRTGPNPNMWNYENNGEKNTIWGSGTVVKIGTGTIK